MPPRLVSLFGILALLGLCLALSKNRKAVSWRLVIVGMLIQAVLGGIFLYWDTGNLWLRSVGQGAKDFLQLGQRGTEFVFGELGRFSSSRNLDLYHSRDGQRFLKTAPFVNGASAPSLVRDGEGRLVSVFEWPQPDLPDELRHLGVNILGADGRWSGPMAIGIEALPRDLGSPFDPCIVSLDDGSFRLYFASSRESRETSEIYSARSNDGVHFEFEAGVRLAVAGALLNHSSVARFAGAWHYLAPVRTKPGEAYHATSSDGLSFERRANVSLKGTGQWRGSAVAAADELRFFGQGWVARSSDGVAWELGPPLEVVAHQDVQPLDPGVALDDAGQTVMVIPGQTGLGFVFATQILPTLIFFSALMGVLYHLGVMQMVVKVMAAVMARLLGTSGAESLSACGNVFVGQTEAPLLVRPYLPRMTKSELHAIMTGGFATIAGGVFALYVGFGVDPGHLIVASVMAAPAGLVCSKLLWPETEESETMGRVVVSGEKTASNVVESAANGALDGLKLALNVGAMLIAFLGLVAVLDWMLGGLGSLFAHDALSVGEVLGWLFSPIAAVMGVPVGEILVLGELLGTKIALTELIAYQQLGAMKASGELTPRTILIASFALCGFANLGSIAIQIGGLGAMAPDRKADLSRLALRAMFAGALATCVTACMAGVMSDA